MKKLAIVSALMAAFTAAAAGLTGTMPSPLLVAGSGRAYLLGTDGKIKWEKTRCGNIHRVWLAPGWVYWANADLWRTEIASGKTELVYRAAPKEGLYGFERLANGNLVVAENANDRVVELDAKTLAPVVSFRADPRDAKGVKPNAHHHFRMVRKTPVNTYLVCCSGAKIVREYDAGGNLVWEQSAPPLAFDALRRANGNTLISSLNAVTEYTRDHKVVWQFKCSDAPELKLSNLCGIQEMPNGNLVIGTYANGAKDGSKATAFEITREKKVVWSYAPTGDRNMMSAFRIDEAEWQKK